MPNTPNITDSMTCSLHTSLASNSITKEHQPCDTIQDAQRVDSHDATATALYAKPHQQGSPMCNPGLPHMNVQLTCHEQIITLDLGTCPTQLHVPSRVTHCSCLSCTNLLQQRHIFLCSIHNTFSANRCHI